MGGRIFNKQSFIVRRLVIVPIGHMNPGLLNNLADSLRPAVGRDVAIEMPEPEPAYAYNASRQQYFSTMILERLKSETSDGEIVLGVTPVDLFVPDLNFVFGEAEVFGRVAVISIARLKQEFYGMPEDNVLLEHRIIKEAVHELGHVYGLQHCDKQNCVMHFSNDLADTDVKQDRFCADCQKKLEAEK